MRTLFVCTELAMQIEGFDTHSYHVDERVHVRFRNRLVPLVIDQIVESGPIREIILRPLSHEETLTPTPSVRVPQSRPAAGPEWIEAFCQAIEGREGPVTWAAHPSSR